MKLDIHFKELELLVLKMEASSVKWRSDIFIDTFKSDLRIKLEEEGIEVDLSDISIEPNGLLHYHGEQILLHIKEYADYGKGGYGLPKFHFYDCRTLKEMRSSGKFDRYVATQRKDGTFLIDKRIGDNHYLNNTIVKLQCCKNCLYWYNRNYQSNCTVYDFDIDNFFQQVSNTPIARKPIHTDLTAPESGYTKDWNDVSLRMREKYRWICQKCYDDFNHNRSYLQVHHINGVKSDNKEGNLKVLCKYCHSQEPYHEHMRN